MKKFLVLVLIAILLFGISRMLKDNKKEIVFGTVAIPFSGDPLEYDYYIHHYAFTSVLARLVSIEKNAEIVPMLAESWSSTNNNQVWKFKFRSNLTYSNGEHISLDHYVKSLKRMAYFKKTKNSNSGVLEFLEGFNTIKSLEENIEGIKTDGDFLILNFIKPMPDLLPKISFGFYSLVHPSLYDENTGEWKNGKSIISSGGYEVTAWSDTDFELSLREKIPYIDYKNRIAKIKFKEFITFKKSSEMDTLDVLVADKNSLMVNKNFEFVGTENGLKIGYVKCHSWNKENSPLNRADVRRWFRKKFYEGLGNAGLKAPNEFFPVNLLGVKPLSEQSIVKPNFPFFKLLTHKMSLSGKIDINANKKSMSEIFQEGLLNLGRDSGAELFQNDENYKEHDVEIKGSGIEVVNYMDTVRFMFLSKEGIKLPDENGKIINELSKNEPDINFINKEMWDQAIIWPIRHYTSGFWFNKNSNIDFSEINFDSPAIDFQFLKWN